MTKDLPTLLVQLNLAKINLEELNRQVTAAANRFDDIYEQIKSHPDMKGEVAGKQVRNKQ